MSDHTMEMPVVGDRLIVEHSEHGGRKRVEVEVTKTARYRFTVRAAGPVTQHLPPYYTEWDIRTGTSWGYRGNYAPRIGDGTFWAENDARSEAWTRLGRDWGLNHWSIKGRLAEAAQADPVRFAAALEQFIINVNEEQK